MGLLQQSEQQYYDSNDYGNYQFTSLDNIISQFMVAYVGENKIISKVKRADVAFHAQRALQELSFDTFKSCKSQEITVPATLQMILPQDYVNYTKISWVDSAGIKHRLYPTLSNTSNPKTIIQDDDGIPTPQKITVVGDLVSGSANIVLDDEYKNIEVGMLVTGPYIPEGTYIRLVSNSGGVTTITMTDDPNYIGDDAATITANAVTPVLPGTTTGVSNTGTTLILSKPASSPKLYSEDVSHVVENLSWIDADVVATPWDYKITASSADDIANIKVGMLVSHNNFPAGTTVTNVSGTTIVVDTTPGTTSAVTGGEITFISTEVQDSTAWSNYKSSTPSENNDDYEDDTYWPADGERYGIDPQHAQANGSFYIDCMSGKIHFSSNISGKTVILDYISDSLGTDGEMQVHKMAEEAMYKCIAYAVLSTRINVQEFIVQRFKKERFAAVRTAKLRLSNIKLEEITQILRGKSKQIKH